MATTHKLIVNKNGLLSACPSNEVFSAGAFLTNPDLFLVHDVRINPKTYLHLWQNRDNAYIVGDGLPDKQNEPGRIHYKLEKGWLKKA